MHIRKLRQFSVVRLCVAIVVLALAALSGCSGASSTTASTSGKSATLTIAVSAGTDTLNPILGGNIDPLLIYEELAYAPLVYLKPDGSYAPALATKWGYAGTGNRDYELTLRSGVKFRDGTPLTADAVKAFFQYVGKAGGQEESARVKNFTSMDVTGPLSLRITLARPDPTLTFAFSQPPGYVVSPKALQHADSLGTSTDGAGQYVLNTTQTVSKQTYAYDANPGYWDQSAVHWKHVIVKVLPNAPAALDAVRTGQADYTIGSPQEAGAATSAGLSVVSGLANFGFVDLFDRTGSVVKALGDIRVRQALNYAIDRKAIASGLYGRYATPSAQILVPGTDGYVDSLNDYYPYDPAKAKQLLAAAGYPNGFTLTLGAYNILPGLTNVAQAIESYWDKVGVKAVVTVPVSTSDWAASVTGKKFPAAVMQYNNAPAYAVNTFFQTPDEFFNPFGIVDNTINQLLQQAAGASGSQATALYQQIQRRLVENAFYVPFASLDKIVIFRRGLQGVAVSPAAPNPNPIYFSSAG